MNFRKEEISFYRFVQEKGNWLADFSVESSKWGVGSGEWGVGSGVERLSLFVVCETHQGSVLKMGSGELGAPSGD